MYLRGYYLVVPKKGQNTKKPANIELIPSKKWILQLIDMVQSDLNIFAFCLGFLFQEKELE